MRSRIPGPFLILNIVGRKEEKSYKIAIQGGYGAFHEIAARHYFETDKIEIVPGETFKDLFKSLKTRQADFGILGEYKKGRKIL